MIMKKIFAICGAALMMFACTKNMIEVQGPDAASSELTFVASMEAPQTKVATSQGKSTWEAGDKIVVYSAAEGAEPGVSVGAGVVYKTLAGGASVEFIADAKEIAASDNYYAYFPASTQYPSKLNAHDGIGFKGVAANATVTDYRFMPVAVNSGVTITYDPTTGETTSKERPYFYAAAKAPAEGGPVELTFKPILPVIEFGLKGHGTVKSMVIAYADKATDVLDNAANKWLSGKGVFDMSTGVFTTTNTSSSAYPKVTVTLKSKDADYIQLDPESPVYFQVSVGRFEVTKGITLTFTDKDGNTFEKTIWTDKTYKGVSDEGKPKFISQVVTVPHKEVVEVDKDSYYEVDMTNVDWTKSYVHHVTVGEGSLVGVITKEFFGATQNKQGIVAYPAPEATADYTKGSVLELTLDGDTAPEGNVHGGSLSAWTTHAADVVYTAGTSAPVSKIYVKGDGSEVLLAAPAGEVKTAVLVPYTLTSTSGEIHPLVKIGERFWTACSYMTTKQIDGTALTEITSGKAPSEGATVYTSRAKGIWLYNGIALGFDESNESFTNKIAPEGWTLPSTADWKTDLADYLGSTAMYNNMSKALLFDRLPYIVKTNATIKKLTYYGIWSCSPSGTKLNMLKCDPDTAPTTSTQSTLVMFETRLVSKK